MKRFWLYLVGVALLAGAIVAVFLAVEGSKDDKTKTSSTSNIVASSNANKACSIFNLADAKQVLGDTAKGGASPAEGASDDLDASSCVYAKTTGPTAPVSSNLSASLLVRSPKTEVGRQSNLRQFDDFKPTVVQNVSGYGDSAYWDTEHGQLNILKNGNWYILSYGPVTPSDRTLDQTKQLADVLINKM